MKHVVRNYGEYYMSRELKKKNCLYDGYRTCVRCGRGEIEYFEGIHTKSCNVPELLKHDFFFLE